MEYPTAEYKDFYERAKEGVGDKTLKLAEKYSIKVTLKAYPSNKRFDLDNALKPTIDALQKLLNFNDSNVYEMHAYKDVVKKGEEKTEVILESTNYD